MLSLPTSDAHDKSFEDATRTNTNNSVLRSYLFFILTLIYNQRHININISSTVETTGHADENVSVSTRIVTLLIDLAHSKHRQTPVPKLQAYERKRKWMCNVLSTYLSHPPLCSGLSSLLVYISIVTAVA